MIDIKYQFFQTGPERVLEMRLPDIVAGLNAHYGAADVCRALDPDVRIPGPYERREDTEWLKTANTVGINVRTVGSFWKIIPYTLTLPDAQNAIHILPIWEPGVVSSLYGPSSWNINPEFYSSELATAFPKLSTVETQLKATVNLLHLMGRSVGMDVVPHTDRYSEMALANPRLFEWLQRRDLEIIRQDNHLFIRAEAAIFEVVKRLGPATALRALPVNSGDFFTQWPEEDRLLALFGMPQDYDGRLRRRKVFIQYLYELGLETVPATMGPPYRGLEVDPRPDAKVTDEEGRVWRDYRIAKPRSMSRVFGPLARYKLYESKNDNEDWELDFEQPNKAAWEYVCRHYRAIQATYGFDFMRGDMSHVQMRPDGVPASPGPWYDIHRAVKEAIRLEKPHFGYFAESFLAPPGEMAYGDECDHLEACMADSTLGDLQSEPMDTPKFLSEFYRYRQWLETRAFAPNFTILTADKDDPRFDAFYLKGNELRYFMSLLLTDMPSYMALGFECRDLHPEPFPNEYYTKLYVFHVPEGPKGTQGPWKWGQNHLLYRRLCRQKELLQRIWPQIAGKKIQWVLPPDAEGSARVLAWRTGRFLSVVNLGDTAQKQIKLPDIEPSSWLPRFSTHDERFEERRSPEDQNFLSENLEPWEGLVFEQAN
jgi:hypothetical protein